MGELIEEGKIRSWGVSNETSYGLTMMCETAKRLGVPLPVTIQNDFSMCDRYAAQPQTCSLLCHPCLQLPMSV